MEIFHDLEGLARFPDRSAALGTFDGLHLGHAAVLSEAGKMPFEKKWGVVTFNANPFGRPHVMTLEDKHGMLEKMGAAFVCALDFEDVKDMTAEAFAEKLLTAGIKKLSCGEDFRFGSGAKGDTKLLKKLCSQRGAELSVVKPVMKDGEKVSSTAVRAAVERGDMLLAESLLGRPFSYRLTVIHGNHLGTGMGTPTANQKLPESLVLPKFGVYASLAETESGVFVGVTNIGVKPTVGSKDVLSETWIPDFSGDIYGREIRVSLYKFLRPERKFNSIDDLKAEIIKNGEQSKAFFKENTRFF